MRATPISHTRIPSGNALITFCDLHGLLGLLDSAEWLAELGPMFFSVKESYAQR